MALGLAASAEDDLAARPSLHEEEGEHDHDDFDSFVIDTGQLVDIAAFRARLAAAICAQDVLRIKGFADVPGRDRRLVIEAVGGRVEHHFDRPWSAGEARATRLVVIGKKGLDRAAVEAALAGDPGQERLNAPARRRTRYRRRRDSTAIDLAQTPGDIVVLASADTEIACLRRHRRGGAPRTSRRPHCGSRR